MGDSKRRTIILDPSFVDDGLVHIRNLCGGIVDPFEIFQERISAGVNQLNERLLDFRGIQGDPGRSSWESRLHLVLFMPALYNKAWKKLTFI
ncbi:hypothetical protein D3H55_22025 [Bacillus salacetis]|uniref:Uncharacterized protein n=1 Tax=Bacillus salacetis TaxID=2315464 RepID=A0A3A1QTJ4_9BACI|nr:hypothetical protein D3H55_22025 [Bacillus salacetis]